MKHLRANNGAFDNLKVQGKELGKGLHQQLKTIKEIIGTIPEQITVMLNSLEEQKNDTEAGVFMKEVLPISPVHHQVDGPAASPDDVAIAWALMELAES